MAIDPTILQQAITQFGAAIGPSIEPYLPAIQRFGMAELLAFVGLLQQKSKDAALQQVHDKMTAEELANEKVKLADLTAAMADSNAEKRATASAILMAVLKAALVIGLGLVGL